jgi:hypothetical protein
MNKDLLQYLLIPSIGYWNSRLLTGNKLRLHSTKLLKRVISPAYRGCECCRRKSMKVYLLDRKHHRDEDKPSHIVNKNRRYWHVNGLRHREGDKPAYIHNRNSDTYYEWWIHGKRHRDGDKPAVIGSGWKSWYKNGERHRIGKPAVISIDGKYEWWVDGNLVKETTYYEK